MLHWFGYVERTNESKIAKAIHRVKIREKIGRGRPRRLLVDQISDLLNKAK